MDQKGVTTSTGAEGVSRAGAAGAAAEPNLAPLEGSDTDENRDGHDSGAPPTECVFRVRLPEAVWAKSKLPPHFATEAGDDETVFRGTTRALLPLARFVVGLGAAAKVETPELRRLVRELAEGALYGSARRVVPVEGEDDNAFAG